ncbi:hypothetical protein KAJ89_03800 [Candidatus Parcubacteria bacterium]|nr:hypothetical protein [Candidatus Parcubacteria bacterium]
MRQRLGSDYVATAVVDGNKIKVYNEPVNMRFGQSKHNLKCQVKGARAVNPDNEVITIEGGMI